MCSSSCCWLWFFFSSRRRHTRLVSDWSSDVCSSDLDYVPRALTGVQTRILWALARQVMAHLEDRRDLGSNPERDSYERYRRFFESSVVEIGRASCRERV